MVTVTPRQNLGTVMMGAQLRPYETQTMNPGRRATAEPGSGFRDFP